MTQKPTELDRLTTITRCHNRGLENGLELADLPDRDGVPTRTISIRHADFHDTGDRWILTAERRFGFGESYKLSVYLTTEEVWQAFGDRPFLSGRPNHFERTANHLTIPGNAGMFNIQVGISSEIIAATCSLLSKYGSLTEKFRQVVATS